MTNSDDYFGWLFRITVPEEYIGCLFQRPISDDFSRWLSEWLFRMPPNDCFGLLFQMNISEACFRWLSRMTVRNSTADSYFSDQFVFPRSIPISTNHSTDWSHNWFDFERLLPTAELWPRSPPPLIYRPEEAKWKRDLDHLLFKRQLRSWTAPS